MQHTEIGAREDKKVEGQLTDPPEDRCTHLYSPFVRREAVTSEESKCLFGDLPRRHGLVCLLPNASQPPNLPG